MNPTHPLLILSILASNFVTPAGAQEPLEWDIEFQFNRLRLDSARPFTFSAALAVDGGRYPSLLFRDPDDNRLKHSHWTSGDRVTEAVGENPGDGHRIAADFDQVGGLHVISTNYGTGDGGPVNYAYRSPLSGAWELSELETAGADDCALALAPDGDPEVAFVRRIDDFEGEMVYGRMVEGSWELLSLEQPVRRLEARPALSVDSAGVAHLIYLRQDDEEQGGLLEYVQIAQGEVEVMVAPPEAGTRPVTAHSAGVLHLAYIRASDSELVYRSRGEDGNWSDGQVLEKLRLPARYSIDIDVDLLGRPVVFDGPIIHRLVDGAWLAETLPYPPLTESTGRVGAGGKLAVAFRNERTSSSYDLGVMVEVADRWREEIVAPQSDHEPFVCRVAALPDGTPQIFSDVFPEMDDRPQGMRSTRNAQGTWDHKPFPYIFSPVTEVVTGDDGITHGIYYTPSEPGVPPPRLWVYIRLEGDTLTTETIFNGRVSISSGADPAGLALDSDGHPHVGFIADGFLYYGSRSPAGVWQSEQVAFIEDFPDVEIGLALDGADQPTLTTDGQVYQKLGGTWQSVYQFQHGEFAQLVARGDNEIFLFYEGAGLRLATSTAGSPWSTSNLWYSSSLGDNFQASIDPQGCLAIAFSDDLRIVVGRRSPHGYWRFQSHLPAPQPDGLVGRMGMDIDQDGRVHVSYVPEHLVDSFFLPTLYYGTEDREVSYASWIEAVRPAGSGLSLAPLDDPDHDARVSFLEYATGGDPFIAEPRAALQVETDPQTGAVRARFHIPDRVRSVRYIARSSSDLQNWETFYEFRTHPQETILDSGNSTQRHRFDGVDVEFSLDGDGGRRYIQLEVVDES
ncbi:MAG: hypothetical protein ACR2RV_25060 [Verrucomicrobiales bacterium]